MGLAVTKSLLLQGWIVAIIGSVVDDSEIADEIGAESFLVNVSDHEQPGNAFPGVFALHNLQVVQAWTMFNKQCQCRNRRSRAVLGPQRHGSGFPSTPKACLCGLPALNCPEALCHDGIRINCINQCNVLTGLVSSTGWSLFPEGSDHAPEKIVEVITTKITG
ncbi:hypothetical protein CMQ_413 [Grosmannia clavigera kw1407]|uniref:Uncharacterized protein n=1 Tax=Grosmannia clavigera (strain kw1407 / UAMH 11150) TaxID=655863 RepID=F0XDL3_GROCL|nr:uncharacterized protein CMQ_413 [Grosmannia clavigera kw1407]EFX03485.1 hypothetical protein CMQ_413 [Grosmannia clavigera kw1407]